MNAKSQQFVNDLALFYRNKGQHGVTSKHLVARINGKPVNLWDLYSCVLEMGGSFKVNQLNQWDDVYARITKKPLVGANVSVALRQIYQRFLMPYEKVNCSNFSNDILDDDDEERYDSFRFNSSFAKDSTSFTLHSSLNSSTSQQVQQQSQAATSVNITNPLNKLFCSLICGLKNEMDFGLKVATILANSKESGWISDYKFIDILLECCDLYSCCCDESSNDYEKENSEINLRNDQMSTQEINASYKCYKCIQKFWTELCEDDEEILSLVFEPEARHSEKISSEVKSKIYNLVKGVAEIIRNLSFNIEEQMNNLQESEDGYHPPLYFNSATLNLLKFIILLISSKDQYFNNLGFDILSNISPITSNNNEQYEPYLKIINKRCVDIILSSNDLNHLNRSLEVISKVINKNNEEITKFASSQHLNAELRKRITELLTCQHDVGLVMTTLECCRALSESYPKFLTIDCNYLIKILLILVNCDASQHFTQNALDRVRVVDEKPRVTEALKKMATSHPKMITNLSTPASTMATSTVDNETFITNYLKSSYEVKLLVSKNSGLRLSEMYEEYVKNCVRCGRKNVIGTQPFALFVKKCFPSIIFVNGTHVEGLGIKILPSSPTKRSTSQLTSPILKAHLSAPSKTTAINALLSSPTSPTPSTPPPTSSASTASTLIKNLLANKLRTNSGVAVSSASSNLINTNNTCNSLENSKKNAFNTATLQTSVMTTATSTTNKIAYIMTNASSSTEANTNQLNMTPSNNSALSCTNFVSMGISSNAQQVLVKTSNSSQPVCSQTSSQATSSQNNSVLITSSQVPTSMQSQQPQQFLLVRTIINNQPQTGLVGVPTAPGTPVRLLLPSTFLTQQRPLSSSNLTMNGITPVSTSTQSSSAVSFTSLNSNLVNVSSTINTTAAPTSITTTSSTSNDILLKAVLGSGIVSDSSSSLAASSTTSSTTTTTSPSRNNAVKSSPLLNVLLDKGKLPDFSTMAGTGSNQVTTNNSTSSTPNSTTAVTFVSNTSNVTSGTTQQPKMFILTTNTPLPIKGLASPPRQNQTTDLIPQQQPAIVSSSTSVTTAQSEQQIQEPSLSLPPTPLTLPLQENGNKPLNDRLTIDEQITDGLNGTQSSNLSSSSSSTSVTINSFTTVKSEPKQTETANEKEESSLNKILNSGCLSNGELIVEPYLPSNLKNSANNSNDLSPIKDIRKTVDDATRLILKRANENSLDVCAKKHKITINSVINTSQSTQVQDDSSKKILDHISDIENSSQPTISVTTSTLTSSATTSSTTNSTTLTTSISTLPSKSTSTVTTADSSTNTSPENSTKTVAKLKEGSSKASASNASTLKPLEYLCEWHNCKKSFTRPSQVYWHVHQDHVNIYSNNSTQMSCHWGGPDGQGPGCQSSRPKLSLLTHLHDFHCNPNVLHQTALRNQHANSGSVTISTASVPPAHPGYAHNAALLAIRRHSINYVEAPKPPPTTPFNPVSISIRITAALILRNLAENSALIKRVLQSHEPYLSELCISEGRDESRTLAQCLAVIIDKNER